MAKITAALLSVYDKTGIVDFARALRDLGVTLLSTGGTYRVLQESGIAATEVAAHTGFPEMLEGRVKTLHPHIHGGILARRDSPDHQREIQGRGITPIDLVVVNFYPFEQTIARAGVTFDEAIENIDIGGPAMVRSAAKNHAAVMVVVDPADYPLVLEAIRLGEMPLSKRSRLAQKAFDLTARYDRAVSVYLASSCEAPVQVADDAFSPSLTLQLQKVKPLRYGENPHQKAALYVDRGAAPGGVATAALLWGKEMSYNNYLDAHAAWELVEDFSETTCVIVKHNNPCGVAIGKHLSDVYEAARTCDPVSAFGGVVACNREIDLETATRISETFIEVLIAPAIAADALTVLQQKKGLRILCVATRLSDVPFEIKRIAGGVLIQEANRRMPFPAFKIVSHRMPTVEEQAGLQFAWTVCKHVKSNAIVLARDGRTLGIGAGQMSRVDSVRIAMEKSKNAAKGCVMASDAFFPFRDGIDMAVGASVTAVIQPGGSIRDAEVIAAADAHDMAMVFTGVRHFRH